MTALLTAVVLALFAGTAVSTLFGIDARRQAELAKQNETEALAKGKELEGALERGKEQQRQIRASLAQSERASTIGKVVQANAALRDLDPVIGLTLLNSCKPETRFWEYYYTLRLCRGAPLVLQGNAFRIIRVLFSPDGRSIACEENGREGDVSSIRDARTGAEQSRLKFGANHLVFSPNSRSIAGSEAVNGTWKIWDVGTGKELATPREANFGIGSGLVSVPTGGGWPAVAR